MDEHDALGRRPDRHAAFSPELLAEVEDEELTRIVREAARELGAPIALVSLVLEHIQFFKAQVGLPADLAASRATDRDVSFCQYVARDGQPFEIPDAARDPRVPQRLVKQYGIRSYLGMPISVGDTVVGSLCVIDVEPRTFTDEQRGALAKLAELVDARLVDLDRARRLQAPSIADRAAAPAVAELARMLGSIQSSAGAGLMTTAALASFLRLARHVQAGGRTPPEMLEAALATARKALEEAEDAFLNIQANACDAEDCVRALGDVLGGAGPPRLSELALSGRELARSQVAAVGGASLPAVERDPLVATPRHVGVALVATCLSAIAARMAEQGSRAGIRLEVRELGPRAEIAARGPLGEEAARALERELSGHAGGDPTVSVRVEDGAVRLLFAVARPDPPAEEE